MEAEAAAMTAKGVELTPAQGLMCLQALSNYVIQLHHTKDVNPQLLADAEALEEAFAKALVAAEEVEID